MTDKRQQFETYWGDRDTTSHEKSTARYAWQAATAVEREAWRERVAAMRERCADIADSASCEFVGKCAKSEIAAAIRKLGEG